MHPNVIDVYWYPLEKMNQIELCKLIYKNKFNILQNILSSSTDGYDKVMKYLYQIYDSQDDLQLQIYCKLEQMQQKKINVFRFTYKLGTKIQDYVNWVQTQETPFESLLQQSHVVRSDE